MAQPSLFVSHGAPTLPLQDVPARHFLEGLGPLVERTWGRPEAILCVSAHWETDSPAVSSAEAPETVHDFYGFPEALYRLRYPAPGAPGLARRTGELLRSAGLTCSEDPRQGLDHGAWVPLLLMWPEADLPVAQFAVQPRRGALHHLTLGRALAPLRSEGVLVLASGGAVHNVPDAMRRRGASDEPPDWATGFDVWLEETVAAGDAERLADYRRQAPGAGIAHPSDEHLLPLLVAFGAGGPGVRGSKLHGSFDFGSLAMSAFAFA